MTLTRGGAEGQNRTADTRIFSPLLYQLSYLGLRAKMRRCVLYGFSSMKSTADDARCGMQ